MTVKQMTDPTQTTRAMPRPWFRANNLNSPICEMFERNRHADRPLREGERRLGGYILPPFQRPPVWTQAQQIRLIESVWGGIPIGAYVHNQNLHRREVDGWLLDGQQRVTAILAYVAGDFPVLGWWYPDLPHPDRFCFETTPITQLQTCLNTEAECLDVYDRLAYGGTAHKPKDATND